MPGIPSVVDLAALPAGVRVSELLWPGVDLTLLGLVVASAGDLNGDGLDDVVIGAGSAAAVGQAYVVFGQAGGLGDLDLTTLGDAGFLISGAEPASALGFSVASAGDVNGDGFDDLLLGAFGTARDGGAAFLIFGRADGFTDLATGALGAAGIRLDGLSRFAATGYSVASAGDMNGDGFDEMLIGSLTGVFPGSPSAGAAFVVWGKADGFANINLITLGAGGFRIVGAGSGDLLPSVAPAGDVNGDGLADIILGVRDFVSGVGYTGAAAYLVLGRIDGQADINLASPGPGVIRISGISGNALGDVVVASAGDLNRDGFDDILVDVGNATIPGLGVTRSTWVIWGRDTPTDIDVTDLGGAGFRITGPAQTNLPPTTVASAGDVNGDGHADLIIGSASIGSAHVVFGRAGGFDNIDLTSFTVPGFRIDGAVAGDALGFSVASAGDVDGDGFDDLIVSAPGIEGKAYILYGQATPGPITRSTGEESGRVTGGAFDDRLGGRGGDDTLVGLDGNDVLTGNDGDDLLVGGRGADTLLGGRGFDTADFSDADGRISVNLDAGTSSFDWLGSIEAAIGTRFGDLLVGSTGANRLSGGEGDDQLFGGAGADTLDGGTGRDTAGYGGSNAGVAVNLQGRTASGGHATGDVLLAIEDLSGSGHADWLAGDAGRNALTGGEGNDTLLGRAGDDVLTGEGGDDLLMGGTGVDVLDGGAGRDRASYAGAASGVSLDLATGGTGGEAAGDSYVSIESVIGSRFDDRLVGDGAGNMLSGGEGDDTLTGGGGADMLQGGAGADRFVFRLAAESFGAARDVIQDFEAGLDLIDLSAIDADGNASNGDTGFAYIGAGGFTAAGQLRVTAGPQADSWMVSANTGGSLAPDLHILVRTGDAPSAGWFLL